MGAGVDCEGALDKEDVSSDFPVRDLLVRTEAKFLIVGGVRV